MGTTSLCVAVNGNNINGQRLVLRTCTSSGAQPNSQLWISGVDPNTKRIQTASTTGAVFCVEVTKSATSVGSAVAINACTTANNQKWCVSVCCFVSMQRVLVRIAGSFNHAS